MATSTQASTNPSSLPRPLGAGAGQLTAEFRQPFDSLADTATAEANAKATGACATDCWRSDASPCKEGTYATS